MIVDGIMNLDIGHLLLKSILAELIQYLIPVLSLGPSSNICPKCASQFEHLTSVLTIPCE